MQSLCREFHVGDPILKFMTINARAIKSSISVQTRGIGMASIDKFPGIDVNKIERISQHLIFSFEILKFTEEKNQRIQNISCGGQPEFVKLLT